MENSRVGQKWTIEEDNELIQEVKDKKSIEEIALNHKRNQNGIILRIIDKIILIEYKNENKTIQDLSNTYNINEETILRRINKNEINNSNKNDKNDMEKRFDNIEKKLMILIKN